MAQQRFEKLVAAAQRGDRNAFSELVGRFYSMVHGLVLSKVGNWSAAADVTQEVFLIVWENLRGLKQARAFPLWLRRIARNTALDWLRNEQFRKRLSAAVARRMQEAPPVAGDPVETAARQECLDQIGEALQALSPKLREALVLHYLEGNTIAESAEALGIREDTMRKRLQLGCALLKTNYESRETPTLEQLLPYSSQPYTQCIMAGLVARSAASAEKESVSHSEFGMIVHHLTHGGSWSAVRDAGVAVPTLSSAGMGVAAFALVCLGLAGVLLYGASGSGTGPSPADDLLADGSTQDNALGVSAIEYWGDPQLGNCVFIPRVFEGSRAARSGLLPGDRIIKVNGRDVQRGYQSNPGFRVQGPNGLTTHLTVIRSGQDGTEHEIEVEVVWNSTSSR